MRMKSILHPTIAKLFTALMATSVIMTSCVKEHIDETADQSTEATGALMTKLAGETSGEIESGCLLIRLSDEILTEIENGAEIFASYGISGIRLALPVPPKNKEIARKYGLDQWYEISFDKSIRPQVMAEKIAVEKAVKAVQYNTILKPVHSGKTIESQGLTATKADTGLPFDDPMLADQWNLINTGDKSIASTAVEGADVGVKDAWRLCAGIPDVVVAVLDEGVRVTHEDLTNALWVNQKEKNGTGGKDDDDNGYADDTNGYNFAEKNVYNKAEIPANVKDNCVVEVKSPSENILFL